MKYLKKIFESSESIIDYDKFSKEQGYRYSISRTIIKKVEDEMRDEILEFFYSLTDDITPESELKLRNPRDEEYFTPVRDIKKNTDTNSWSYKMEDSLYDYRGNSSTNTISKTSRDFCATVRVNLTKFDSNSIMSEVKAIYSNITDSGYKCSYSFNHKLKESNLPNRGYKGEQTQSLDLDFHIHIKGEKVLDRIGVDYKKL